MPSHCPAHRCLAAALLMLGASAVVTRGRTEMGTAHQENVPEDDLPKEREVERGLERGMAAWANIKDNLGMTVHRPGSDLISGAATVGIAYEMVRSALSNQSFTDEIQKARSLDGQAASLERRFSKGVEYTFDETTNQDGTYYLMEVDGDCRSHGQYGDNDCTSLWGSNAEFRGGINVNKPVEAGSTIQFDVKFHVLQAVPGSGNLVPDLTATCAACGPPCEINFGVSTLVFETGECPLESGYYSLWVKKFTLPDNVVIRSLSFNLEVVTRLLHKNGDEIYRVNVHTNSIEEGFGGGWAADIQEPV